MKFPMSPEGHQSPHDCQLWGILAYAPLYLTAGTPHSLVSDYERDAAFLEAGVTRADLVRALGEFLVSVG